MRTKILLVPTLILVTVYTIVTMIVPDWEKIQQKKVDLVKREEQLENIKEKNIKINDLEVIYNNEANGIKLTNEYIPYQIGDEEIINNLIFYANSLGGSRTISVSSMSLNNKSQKDNSPGNEAIPEIAENHSPGMMGNMMDIGETLPKVDSFEVDISFTSSYEGMKEFFAKINTLKRVNTVSSFEVAKDNSENSIELSVSATLNFNSLKKYNPGFVDGNLLKDDLDKEVIKKIADKATADSKEVRVDSVGKNNPFLP